MKFISYFRVSSQRQGRSGLGLEAQKETVRAHMNGHQQIAEYSEIESGRKTNRIELASALQHCQRTGACLVIARLDRLARNCRFLLNLLDSGVELYFCDLPQLSGASGKFMVSIMASVAEMESGLASERTKLALAAAKKRGVILGARKGKSYIEIWNKRNGNKKGVGGIKKAADARAAPWRGILDDLVARGLGNAAICERLNEAGEQSVRGCRWTTTGVTRLRCRLAAMDSEPLRHSTGPRVGSISNF